MSYRDDSAISVRLERAEEENRWLREKLAKFEGSKEEQPVENEPPPDSLEQDELERAHDAVRSAKEKASNMQLQLEWAREEVEQLNNANDRLKRRIVELESEVRLRDEDLKRLRNGPDGETVRQMQRLTELEDELLALRFENEELKQKA